MPSWDPARLPQGHRDTPGPGKTAGPSTVPGQPQPGGCAELNCNLDNEGAGAFLSLMQWNKPRWAEKPARRPDAASRVLPRGLRQRLSATVRPPPARPRPLPLPVSGLPLGSFSPSSSRARQFQPQPPPGSSCGLSSFLFSLISWEAEGRGGATTLPQWRLPAPRL